MSQIPTLEVASVQQPPRRSQRWLWPLLAVAEVLAGTGAAHLDRPEGVPGVVAAGGWGAASAAGWLSGAVAGLLFVGVMGKSGTGRTPWLLAGSLHALTFLMGLVGLSGASDSGFWPLVPFWVSWLGLVATGRVAERAVSDRLAWRGWQWGLLTVLVGLLVGVAARHGEML